MAIPADEFAQMTDAEMAALVPKKPRSKECDCPDCFYERIGELVDEHPIGLPPRCHICYSRDESSESPASMEELPKDQRTCGNCAFHGGAAGDCSFCGPDLPEGPRYWQESHAKLAARADAEIEELRAQIKQLIEVLIDVSADIELAQGADIAHLDSALEKIAAATAPKEE